MNLTKEINLLIENNDLKMCEEIKNKLIKMDEQIYKKVDKTKYKIHSWVKRTIIFQHGPVTFKRRKYKKYSNKKIQYVYLLDKKLGLNKNQRIWTEFQKRIISYLGLGKRYIDILDIFPNCNLKEMTISNIFKKHKAKENQNFIKPKLKDNQVVYINVDDSFPPIKINNRKIKSRVRTVSFHLGKDKKKSYNNRSYFKHKRVAFKTTLTGEIINTFEFSKELYEKGMLFYDNFAKANLVLYGDGATWIRDVASIIGANFVLDKFHAYKIFKELFIRGRNKLEKKNWKKYRMLTALFETGHIDWLLEFLKSNDVPIEIINYFRRNKIGVINQNKWWNIGSCTESDVKRLVKIHLSGGRVYNIKVFNNILISKANQINLIT